jgi:TP901-1 family phage major tail protein
MAAQSGKAIVVSITNNEDPAVAEAIAGLRSRSISINSETVDITNADSTGNWRELLPEVGVRSCSISGSGVFTDDSSEEEIREVMFANTFRTYTFLVPDFGTFSGSFQVTSLEYAGEYNGEVTYSVSFESSGAVTFSAA